MPINKGRIRAFETNKAKNMSVKKVDNVNMELLLTLDETTKLLQNNKCKDIVPYILWNDLLNKSGTFTEKNKKKYNRYKWGDKVFVDFGATNIQTELSYPHPAILLYNLANTAIVVPTTTDDRPINFTDDIEGCIIKVKSDGIIFPNDSIINVHQICSVHKERIINDLKCNVASYTICDNEVVRLNNYENYAIFQKGMDLIQCIRLKLFSMVCKDYIDHLFMEEAYNINEINNLLSQIELLKMEKENLKNS